MGENMAAIALKKKIERRCYALLSYLSPELNTRALFRRKFGRAAELEHPRTLNEKLLRLKLTRYGTDALVRRCADKYAVREYVEAAGCGELLTRLLGVYDKPEDIDWALLPDEFVLKWNFGCGYNLICPDKSALDIPAAVKRLKRWGREDFWAYYSELQYRGVPKKLVAEQYLKPKSGTQPEDYKFYCFHGSARCVMLCEGREQGWPRFYFFDRDWKLLPINRDSRDAPEGFTLPRPEGIDAAFAYADRLSAPFPFVRTDLYLVDGKVYFGELTFTPAAALDNKRLPETDLMFGELLHID